ncbi:TRAP transporter small permease [Bhargavaea beijingensis]|uniref:TRAP transporter small permease n=1 Tax=Bhargavaea beijingensis TaxID=426756 RepID=UPI00222581CF|nr:TRAP transporter small permease [Bhargavaea beijingensis]MCW1927390.1 TRAP transporter small permease [Bhargavaea beijingensis]
MLKRWVEQSAKVQSFIIGMLLIILTVVVFIQVVARKVSPVPIPWTEELARLSMIWLTYLGLAATFQRNVHIRVDLIDLWLKSEKAERWNGRLIDLLGILFSGMLFYLSGSYFSEQLEYGQTTSTLDIPMWIVVLPIVIGSLFTLLHFLLHLFIKEEEGSA